ncbi:MAG: acyl carrier protein [Lachnospiraceae bacterium]|nr:acyl carrier protein [Lachnospiraceae bacterium]
MSFEKVKEIIMDTTNCDADNITMDTNLKEDLGLDSLDAMELSMALEEHYKITIEEEALKEFDTVGKIVEYVDKHVA